MKIGGQPVKRSRVVRVGDLVTAETGEVTRTVKVVAVLANRVGAPRVPEFMEDLTPPSEFQKPREHLPSGYRPKGSGRPTKRDRRILHGFFE